VIGRVGYAGAWASADRGKSPTATTVTITNHRPATFIGRFSFVVSHPNIQ
jgi:hypothetical protein